MYKLILFLYTFIFFMLSKKINYFQSKAAIFKLYYYSADKKVNVNQKLKAIFTNIFGNSFHFYSCDVMFIR